MDLFTILILGLGACIPLAILLYIWAPLRSWLSARRASLVSFKYCLYLGGSLARQLKDSSMFTLRITEEGLVFGGWQWRGKKPFCIPREQVRAVRRFESPQRMPLDGIELVTDFDTFARISSARTMWNWIIIYWSDSRRQEQQELVMFMKSSAAAEMRRFCVEEWMPRAAPAALSAD